MTTNAINSIGVVGNPKIAFKKEVEENVEKKEIQSEDKSSMLVAGLAAAAALGVAGFMIAKGRGGRAGEQGQETVETLVNGTKGNLKPKKTKPVKKVEVFATSEGGKNKLVTVTNPDGKITRTTNFYDKDGNLTKVTVKGGENGWEPVSTTTFSTKGNLKMSETTYNNGKSIKKVVKDAAGNIKSKKYIKLDDSGNVVSETYIKKFDKSGQPLEKRIITYNEEQKTEKFLVKENNVWKEVSGAKK